MNLIERLGLEKCKAIIDGAPVDAKTYSLILHMYSHLEIVTPFNWIFLSDIRAAIADHERTDYVSDIRNHIAPTTVVIDK